MLCTLPKNKRHKNKENQMAITESKKKAIDKHSAKTATILKTYRFKELDVRAFDVLCNKEKLTKAGALSYLLKLHHNAVKAAKTTT